jgi:prepilin-type N-terminal cleavage/methylation domain-containing protein
MLKLRKNKKGFTLVELIVVIAIMAVLAGTVAGVTVSQLNKNTDKANGSQAKTIADFISSQLIEGTIDLDVDGGFTIGTIEAPADGTAETAYTLGNRLYNQFGNKVAAAAVKGGAIGVSYAAGTKTFTVSYDGKQGNDNGDATYTVNAEGVVNKTK